MTASHQPRHTCLPRWAWLRLCLLLTLWQAPVPLVHAHEAAGWDQAALARHVAEFHGDAAAPEKCKWHWHLVLPAWGCPALPPQSNDDPAEPVQFDVTVVRLDDSATQDASDSLGTFLATWWTPQPDLSMRPATAGRSFLTTYSVDVPLHRLLRVIRC